MDRTEPIDSMTAPASGSTKNTSPNSPEQMYMNQAIELARLAKGFTTPNPCVGAVVVKDGQVVGQGYHKKAGTPHAEVHAIDDAGSRAAGAAIYVTLEPCNHFGKTPPCTHKIIQAGIKKVIVGCKDPNPFVAGNGIQHLQENGIEVVSGVLEQECRDLIEDFIWYIQNEKQPFVILKCAATLDGQIATSTGDSQWITNAHSRGFGHQVRHEADAILVGSGTLHADNPSLTSRIEGKKTRDPHRVILDTRLTMKENAKVINPDSEAKTIIVTGPGIPDARRRKFENLGAELIEVPLSGKRLDLNQVMIKLGRMSILSVLIEGGGTVAAEALKTGIVNKILYFIAPKFLGGNDGVPVFSGAGPKRIDDAYQLGRVDVTRFEQDLLVTGYLK